MHLLAGGGRGADFCYDDICVDKLLSEKMAIKTTTPTYVNANGIAKKYGL